MNGIIGFSELLDDPDISHEKRKYYSKIVQNSSQQLLRIIDDILEISTIETRQQQVREDTFNLNDLIMELFSIYDLKSKERKIPLYIKKEFSDKKSTIISDKAKLNRILGNLIENAIKFTNSGFIELGYFKKGHHLIIYVKDTGIGISPQNFDKIFERFSQEEKEISCNHGGLGLGLSISKENAKLLGGDIHLESEKGKGSIFYVTIPYRTIENQTNNLENRAGNNSLNNEALVILLAEDEEMNYLFFEALFQDKLNIEYKLIHARNGKEAVDICLTNNDIDIVLMDIKMPVLNGYKAAQKIKLKKPDLPIIAQTAYSTQRDKEIAIKNGCDDFISKPINKNDLFDLIEKYLKRKKKQVT